MKVVPVAGEATRYYCESMTLECTNTQCGKRKRNGDFDRTLFNKRLRPDLHAGDCCPACPTGRLDVRFHIVDVAAFNCNGSCSCEYFGFTLGPQVRTLTAAEMGEGKHRCSHIDWVRDYCLDLTIKAHEKDRMAHAGGQREEDQP